MSRDGSERRNAGPSCKPTRSTRIWSRRICRAAVQAREERPALAKTGGCFSFVAGALDDAPALRAERAIAHRLPPSAAGRSRQCSGRLSRFTYSALVEETWRGRNRRGVPFGVPTKPTQPEIHVTKTTRKATRLNSQKRCECSISSGFLPAGTENPQSRASAGSGTLA